MNYILLQDQVQVFYGNVADFCYTDCRKILSEKEISRAEQFRLKSDQNRYIISRAILKKLLSNFLNLDIKEIEFFCGKNGKSFLYNNTELQFNVSHSEDLFVIGFTYNKEIGVDVENLNRDLNMSSLQSYLFTPFELKHFNAIDPNDKQKVFINSWTRKEAFLKACGKGLTKAMNTVDIAFINNNHFMMEECNEHLKNKTEWFIENNTLMENYRIAVAVKGKVQTIQYIPVNI